MSEIAREGWTTEPPTEPGKYWLCGVDILGAMGADYTDHAECRIKTTFVKIFKTSNSIMAVADGHFIGLDKFDKKIMREGHIGWWKKAEVPEPPTNFEEIFDGFKIINDRT